MDVLGPWLAATIEGELAEALRRWEDGIDKNQSNPKSQELSYDDDSNLRIPSTKKGPLVQITKFLTFEDPIQVTLSDSVIRVNASIANQASAKYTKKERKRVTEGTLGGLIQLQEFEIVATHIGPRDKRLTLYVKDFKSIGSNGEGKFGVAPQAIEGREGTKELLKKLAGLRDQTSNAHSEQSATASPIQSQSSTQTSVAENDQDSQIGFATQVPRSVAPIPSKPKSRNSTTNIKIRSTSTIMGATSLVSPPRAKQRDLSTSTTNPQAYAARQRPSANNNKALLSLLKNPKRAPLQSRDIPEPSIDQLLRHNTASSGKTATERENVSSRVNTLATGNDDTPRDPIESQKRQKRKRSTSDDVSKKKAADKHDSHAIDKVHERLASNHDLENGIQAGSAFPEISEDILASQPNTPSTLQPAKLDRTAPLESLENSISKPTISVSAEKISRIRISSRDVNIPKDQEAILSRTDSWLPAEPGQREPTANIPISLLKTLNRKADVRTQQSTRKQMNVRRTLSPGIDLTTDSETDRPLSSGQWPASPERDQLPPDSSLEATECSDHSGQMMLDQPRSVCPTRTQSRTPTSSQSTPSRQSSLVIAKQVTTQSGSPRMSSPGFPSPSGTSTTAGEGANRFMCQVTDCGKSYKRSGGLKHHIDRDHQGSQIRNDEEEVKHASTRPILGTSSSPDAPPALMEHVKGPDEVYVAKDKLSPLLPASSDPESDLEMTIPSALNDIKVSIAGSSPMQKVPSTASQPQDPFTQVKRTPYVNGRLQDQLLHKFGVSSSPLKSSCHISTNETTNDENEFVSASVASGPETPTVEDHSEEGSTQIFRDQSIEENAVRFAHESKDQEVTDSIAVEPGQSMAGVEQGKRKVNSVENQSVNLPLIITKSHCQIPGSNLSFLATTSDVNDAAVSEEFPTEMDNHVDHPSPIPISDDAVQVAHEMKRKAGDPSFVSPSAAKRQKTFKPPSVFKFMERSENPRDPAEGARQYRQEFLASRRSSESSTPTMSPTKPLTIFPTITLEGVRDPSERARQIRQEFLASKRSSENSNPTTSPSKSFPALLGAFPTEYCDAVVGKNVEQAKVQNQSAGTDVQHQTTIEQKMRSPESQPRGIDLKAVPLVNDVAEVEPDVGDGKLCAQGTPICDHEVDSPLIARENAQHTDVEGHDAEQRIVIEASSCALNKEKQRTHSVELDATVRSPDHLETEDRVANTKDGASQTIEVEEDMQLTHYDRLANRGEEDRPVELDPHRVLRDSIAPVNVAKFESNVPARKSISDDVADPHTVALNFMLQQHAVETSEDLISGQRACEPTPRQNPVAANAVTPLPDELAKEATYYQQRVGQYANSPIPDLQAHQETETLEPIADIYESTNHTRPFSPAALTLNPDNNTENQSNLSPTAFDPTNPLSRTTSRSEVQPVESRQTSIHVPNETSETKTLAVSQSLFDTFKIAYPAYTGDMKHFTAICRKISQLAKANRMEHQSLWDDFIVRHKVEYSQYLQRCADDAEDAVPFEVFYQTEIEGPRYLKRIVNRRNIDEALAPVIEQANSERRAEPVDNSTFVSGLVIEEVGHGKVPANNEPLQTEENASTAKPVVSNINRPVPSSSRVLIDLTGDDLPDDLPRKTSRREVPAQSNLPPLVNSVSVGTTPLQSRQEGSGNIHPIPIIPTTTSTKRTTRNLRRLLPREGSSHSVVQGSPGANVSDSSRRLVVSGLREIRAKGSSNANDAHLDFPAVPTSNSSKQSQGHLKTCQRVIQTNWGIKAHELLEPEYSHGQVWSNCMIELLAEIASNVSVREARNRIKEAIDTRIEGGTRREAGHPSQDRKVVKSDLEVVRGIVVTSSMSTTSPFSPPHTNAAMEKQAEGTSVQWWDDDNSPYKSFARAYASIRPGKGNSFATTEPAESGGDKQKKEETTSSGVRLKKINIMKWTF